jgi:lipopolysaccharide/colanic/teichoic acid biosynthesis glycosyltransferase
MAKRLLDLSLAFLGLALVWPIGIGLWLAVEWEDGGPLFYRQTRIGQFGRPFQIVKFRTMLVGADKAGPAITASGDQRVTRIGRMLRKTKLDELPQLWNVLCGDMSFVGPRPEVPKYVSLYTPAQRAVLALKPGITDEASIVFRDEEEMLATASDPESFYVTHCLPRKIELNLAYARHAGLRNDLAVVIRTINLLWLRR